ncbi:hypothetical protein GCM10017764_21170 [Sphingobacterium griseoflavum]|uniref:Uncharacterized protein n=1 Tax=Sphingobacterium griseoflavum TaxID=1474952 RepID=A0ABQ3HVF4_9SPHI|nr:hypothetical protein GCM10017764_21170 [Sphingobacterium griseoflavum]
MPEKSNWLSLDRFIAYGYSQKNTLPIEEAEKDSVDNRWIGTAGFAYRIRDCAFRPWEDARSCNGKGQKGTA